MLATDPLSPVSCELRPPRLDLLSLGDHTDP